MYLLVFMQICFHSVREKVLTYPCVNQVRGVEIVDPASCNKQIMSDHVSKDGRGVTLRTRDCEVVCFVPNIG